MRSLCSSNGLYHSFGDLTPKLIRFLSRVLTKKMVQNRGKGHLQTSADSEEAFRYVYED